MSRNALPIGNQFLASLPPDSVQRFRTDLEQVEMKLGDAMMRSGEPIAHVCFPTAGYVSLLFGFSAGPSSEIGMIGRDGVIGSSLVLSSRPPRLTAMVQCSGTAYRMTAARFRSAVAEDQLFSTAIMRYADTLMNQIALTAACNCKHSIRQRLARWILMAQDRSDTDLMPMTQEMLAMLLGSYRPSITEAAAFLKRAGAIRYAHGKVTITDRAVLEGHACECYAIETGNEAASARQ